MNCKAGDLAIIIRGLNGPSQHIGKIVKVIQPAMHPVHPKLGHMWLIEFSTPVLVGAYRKNLKRVELVGMVNHSDCADDWLRPIPPADEPLETDTATAAPDVIRVLEPA